MSLKTLVIRPGLDGVRALKLVAAELNRDQDLVRTLVVTLLIALIAAETAVNLRPVILIPVLARFRGEALLIVEVL